MSASSDTKIYIWDNSKCGEEQARADYEDGPTELLFHHETHNSAVDDLSWSPHEPYNVVSTESDLMLQVWKMSHDFIDNDESYLDKLDLINDYDLEWRLYWWLSMRDNEINIILNVEINNLYTNR